jgi:hypothetical protein
MNYKRIFSFTEQYPNGLLQALIMVSFLLFIVCNCNVIAVQSKHVHIDHIEIRYDNIKIKILLSKFETIE